MRTSTGGRPQGALPGPVSRLQARVDAGDAIRDSLLAIASALKQPKLGRARRRLLQACRSVAQALEHRGKGGATGTEAVAHPRERAMPKSQPQQATWAHRQSVLPLLALAQPRTAQEGLPNQYNGCNAKAKRRAACERAQETALKGLYQVQ